MTTHKYCLQCGTSLARLIQGLLPSGYCVNCAREACGEGDGERVGLPPVPEDSRDEVIVYARHVLEDDESETITNGLADWGYCGECDRDTSRMPTDDESHIIVQDVVLIGCEGYHTPVFRWLALLWSGEMTG